MKWFIGALTLLIIMSNRVLALAVKPGVTVPLTPEMNYAEQIVARVWAEYGLTATITSGTDGTHRKDSKHYLGLAEDFRTKNLSPELRNRMIQKVRAILGSDYDVILEYDGLPNEHLHIEFDPK